MTLRKWFGVLSREDVEELQQRMRNIREEMSKDIEMHLARSMRQSKRV